MVRMKHWTLATIGGLLLAGGAQASSISVNGIPVLNNDYESDTVAGQAPEGWPSGWTSAGALSLVTDAPMPGPAQGQQYLHIDKEPTTTGDVKYTFASPIQANSGQTIRLDTMLWVPPAPNASVWYQSSWYDTSGTLTGAANSPILMAFFGTGADLNVSAYDGTAYQATGLSLTGGAWNRFAIDYTPGADDWTLTINGTSQVQTTFNSRTADRGVGTINFFINNAGTGNPFFLDAVPESTPIIDGDYNANGTVDAADYVVWRANVGTTNMLPNDSIGGEIGDQHYLQWKTNFGATGDASGSVVGVVPEPASFVLCIFVLTAFCSAGRCDGRLRG